MGKYDDILTAVGRAAPPPKYIRAYHGSPYDFDAFDFAGHMGRGEGNQAFGHGGYFAEVEDAAKHYKTVETPELTLDQERELTAVLKRMRELKGLTKSVPKTDPRAAAMIDEWSRLTSRRASLEEPPGHMYEVRIDYPEEALLDLDMPVMQQPQAIQKALGPYAEPHKYFSFGREDWAGKHAYTRAADVLGGAPHASQALLSEGVPGLRFLDGLSRGPGKGTRNYVMFPGTEDSIRILRKYGLLAPMAAGAMQDE
jgi:hypothetical protein